MREETVPERLGGNRAFPWLRERQHGRAVERVDFSGELVKQADESLPNLAVSHFQMQCGLNNLIDSPVLGIKLSIRVRSGKQRPQSSRLQSQRASFNP